MICRKTVDGVILLAFAQEKMLSKDPPASGGATVYSNQNWMSDLKKNFSVEIVLKQEMREFIYELSYAYPNMFRGL